MNNNVTSRMVFVCNSMLCIAGGLELELKGIVLL